jgi:hypothetical protein
MMEELALMVVEMKSPISGLMVSDSVEVVADMVGEDMVVVREKGSDDGEEAWRERRVGGAFP